MRPAGAWEPHGRPRRNNMRLAAITMAVATVLVAGGCNRIGGGGAEAGRPRRSISTSRPPARSPRSGINFNDGSHHQLYQIKLEDRDLVGLKLTGALSGSVAVFNNGSLVSTSNTGYEREGTSRLSVPTAVVPTRWQSTPMARPRSALRLRAEKLKPYDGAAGGQWRSSICWPATRRTTLQVDKAGLYDPAGLGRLRPGAEAVRAGRGCRDDDGGTAPTRA